MLESSLSGMVKEAAIAENVNEKEDLKNKTKGTILDVQTSEKMKQKTANNEERSNQEFPLLSSEILYRKLLNDSLFSIKKVASNEEEIYHEKLEALEHAEKAVADAKTFVKMCDKMVEDARERRQQFPLLESDTLYHEVLESSFINIKEEASDAKEFYRETLEEVERAKEAVTKARISVETYHEIVEGAEKHRQKCPLLGSSTSYNKIYINKQKTLENVKSAVADIEISSELKHKIVNNIVKYIEEIQPGSKY